MTVGAEWPRIKDRPREKRMSVKEERTPGEKATATKPRREETSTKSHEGTFRRGNQMERANGKKRVEVIAFGFDSTGNAGGVAGIDGRGVVRERFAPRGVRGDAGNGTVAPARNARAAAGTNHESRISRI